MKKYTAMILEICMLLGTSACSQTNESETSNQEQLQQDNIDNK